MVVQTNALAAYAANNIKTNNTDQKKTSEKLSSGYRINRAADDAASLTISEKMRSQIRGLHQASKNAQDGISMVQTAEGALAEVHDILQRMNELSIKAANGTNTSQDRGAIASEFSELTAEIDRIGTSTEFNTKKLLCGVWQQDGHAVLPSYVGGSVIQGNNNTPAMLTVNTPKYGEHYTFKGTDYEIGERTEPIWETFVIIDEETGEEHEEERIVGYRMSVSDALINIENDIDKENKKENEKKGFRVETVLNGDRNNPGNTVEFEVSFHAPLQFDLQVGAKKGVDVEIPVYIERISAAALRVNNLSLKTEENAKDAIEYIKTAIGTVSDQRSGLGAIQNRLESTIRNLDNVVENTQDAESKLRDTDMAEEMTKNTKQNLLAQAGQSVMRQANQQQEGVLRLLNG